MRLGGVQRDVMLYLSRCPPQGAPICSTTKAAEFRGYDLEQVEQAIARLMRRNIIRKDGIRYVVNQ